VQEIETSHAREFGHLIHSTTIDLHQVSFSVHATFWANAKTMPNKRTRTEEDDSRGERLQKVLAAAGFGSRRQCEELILAGRVTVDGRVSDDLGVRVDPRTQQIALDGEVVRPERKVYYMLNKPTGVLCTSRDPSGRTRVIDLFPKNSPRLFTVGRLDENTQGLLLVTNDGELANRLAHPRYQVPRTYHAQVAGIPNREVLGQLRQGLHFAEGRFRVQRVRRLRTKGNSAVLEMVLAEGGNREIRRLLARVGHKVMRLERVGFGTLKLGRLAPGRYRPLKPPELKALRELDFKRPPQRTSDRPKGKKKNSRRTRK